jgi:hypothetical protein
MPKASAPSHGRGFPAGAIAFIDCASGPAVRCTRSDREHPVQPRELRHGHDRLADADQAELLALLRAFCRPSTSAAMPDESM